MEALIFHPDKVFILEGKWKGKGKHITKIVHFFSFIKIKGNRV